MGNTTSSTDANTKHQDAAQHAAPHALSPALYVPVKAISRYSLIGAFGEQLAHAAPEAGMMANPALEQGLRPIRPSIFTFFNFASSAQMVYDWIGPTTHMSGTPVAIAQWLIDHPFNLERRLTEELLAQPGYRLVTVGEDDASLLRLKYPSLQHLCVSQGVCRRSLVDARTIEPGHIAPSPSARSERFARDIPVLFAGTIASDTEVEQLRAQVPASGVLERVCEDIVRLRIAHPWLSFTQAWEHCCPTPLACADHWGLLSVVFRYTTALLNRERRIGILKTLGALPVRICVLGTSSWKPALDALRHDGARADFGLIEDVPYADVPAWMARARVCIAINPTQFVHAFSERPLLSMAAGCATITDDRLCTRRAFHGGSTPTCVIVPVSHDRGSSDAWPSEVDALLASPKRCAELGIAGRALVEREHLWSHRLRELLCKLGMNARA